MSKSSMQAYVLFDLALLRGTNELSDLLQHPGGVALYDDLGANALDVGPLLFTAGPVASLAAGLLAAGGQKRAACSQLISPANLEEMVAHLRALRLLRASGEREFYFRYADGRAFQAMWQVLSDEQRVALMGPVQSWQCAALDGTAPRRIAPVLSASSQPARLPLRLSPSQWHALLECTRVEELRLATALLARSAQPPCAGEERMRRTWTQETYRLLSRYGIQDQVVRVTANLVMWQTGGRFARDSVFHAALRDAERKGQIDYLRSFGALGAA